MLVRGTFDNGYRYMPCGYYLVVAGGSLVHTGTSRRRTEEGATLSRCGLSHPPTHWMVAGRAWTLARVAWYLLMLLRQWEAIY